MKTFARAVLASALLLPLSLVTPDAAIPVAASTTEVESFMPISPVRVLDTRTGVGAAGPLGPDDEITLQLEGLAELGDNVDGVVMNVTSVDSSEPSFITVWSTDVDRPDTSNLNTEPGQNTPNLVVSAVGADGAVKLYNRHGTGHLVADVTAVLRSRSDITPLTPARILDTRSGTGSDAVAFGPDETRTVQVRGVGGVPDNAAAVIVNLTSTQASAPSFVTAYPSGDARPNAATLNTEVGQNTPNLAVVELGPDGAIDLYNRHGSTHLIADVMAYIGTSSNVAAASPERFLDTRTGTGTNGSTLPLGPGETIDLTVAGVGDVPANATAVIVNITSTDATEASFITAWPTGEGRPTAASLNTEVGQNTPNLAMVKIGDDGSISLYNRGGTTHLTADVAGWYVPASSTSLVEELTFFKGWGHRSTEDFFVNRGSAYRYDTGRRTIDVFAGAAAFAVAEDFSASSRLFTPFGATRSEATRRYDVGWNGSQTSFVGMEAYTSVTVTVALYETDIDGPGPATFGDVVWDRVIVNEGIGSGLQAIGFNTISGRESRAVELPTLEPGKAYRLSLDLTCETRVAFSVGTTICDFYDVDDASIGAWVNSWSIEYHPVG